jgi:hypothetical protein
MPGAPAVFVKVYFQDVEFKFYVNHRVHVRTINTSTIKTTKIKIHSTYSTPTYATPSKGRSTEGVSEQRNINPTR